MAQLPHTCVYSSINETRMSTLAVSLAGFLLFKVPAEIQESLESTEAACFVLSWKPCKTRRFSGFAGGLRFEFQDFCRCTFHHVFSVL